MEIEEHIMFALLKQSDARQVRKVLSGQRDAFAPLVDRYLPAVYAVSYAQTGNHADAEDAAQEAFLSAFQSLHTLREPGKFEGWVVAIARRAAAKVRERKPRNEVTGVDGMEDSTYPDPARQELRRLLREEIERLEEEPREVLLLHYFAGMSAREIAGALDISREAAKKRLQRARQIVSENLLSAIHEETPPEPGFRKQKTAIMGLVGATTVAWGSGAAAAAGLLAWIPGGAAGLAAGAAVVAVVAGGVLYTVSQGDSSDGDAGTQPVAQLQETAREGDASGVESVALSATGVPATTNAQDAAQEVASTEGEQPFAGLWRACESTGQLRGNFGPGGDFIVVAQTGENLSIYGSGRVIGAGEELAAGEIHGDVVEVRIPGELGESVLSGTLTDSDAVVLSGVVNNGHTVVPLEITLTRLNEREAAEVEIWGRRQLEMRALASALSAYFKDHDHKYPEVLEQLNDGYLENPQWAISSGSRRITYTPYGPSDVDTSGYPPELSAAQRLLRKEEDALRAWPDFPAPMPRLRIDYAAPPMVLQFVSTNPDAVFRSDEDSRLRCPEVADNRVADGDAPSLIASCQNNMKQLGLVMKMFSNEAPEERYPPGWAVVYPEYLTDLKVLTCPSLDEEEGPNKTISYELLFPAANEAELQAFAAEWGLIETTDRGQFQSTLPTAIEVHDCADGKSRNVLFMDGHVQKYGAARWEAEIAPFLDMAEAFQTGR